MCVADRVIAPTQLRKYSAGVTGDPATLAMPVTLGNPFRRAAVRVPDGVPVSGVAGSLLTPLVLTAVDREAWRGGDDEHGAVRRETEGAHLLALVDLQRLAAGR